MNLPIGLEVTLKNMSIQECHYAVKQLYGRSYSNYDQYCESDRAQHFVRDMLEGQYDKTLVLNRLAEKYNIIYQLHYNRRGIFVLLLYCCFIYLCIGFIIAILGLIIFPQIKILIVTLYVYISILIILIILTLLIMYKYGYIKFLVEDLKTFYTEGEKNFNLPKFNIRQLPALCHAWCYGPGLEDDLDIL